MTSDPLSNTHPTGTTSGTAQRPGQAHSGEVMSFDLADEVRHLAAEDAWQAGERNARTLVKEGDLRVLLLALKAGAQLPPHILEGRLTVQVLGGKVRVQAVGDQFDLPAGRLLVLDYATQYQVEAQEESQLLLTVVYAGAGDATPTLLFDAELQA